MEALKQKYIVGNKFEVDNNVVNNDNGNRQKEIEPVCEIVHVKSEIHDNYGEISERSGCKSDVKSVLMRNSFNDVKRTSKFGNRVEGNYKWFVTNIDC